MSNSTQPPLRARARPGRLLAPLLQLLLLLLLLLPLSAPAAAGTMAQRWTLTDEAGARWGLSLFAQPDPDYPPGLRLRLQALSGGRRPDHSSPLGLRDGSGAVWTLPNRSGELVPLGQSLIPDATAQFDAAALNPRPSDVVPLRLSVPLVGETDATALLVLPPDAVQALHQG